MSGYAYYLTSINTKGMIIMLFLPKLLYLIIPLALQIIQYSAISSTNYRHNLSNSLSGIFL